jgi:hypothetical protein
LRALPRVLLHAAWLALAASWPWTDRYTSFGLDHEQVVAGRCHSSHWRLRWPGDGSIALAWIAESRPARQEDADGWDPGGRFLQPPKALSPSGPWQRNGFWWVSADAALAPVPAIFAGADRAVLVGVPHALLLAIALLAAGMQELRLLRHRRLASAPAPA